MLGLYRIFSVIYLKIEKLFICSYEYSSKLPNITTMTNILEIKKDLTDKLFVVDMLINSNLDDNEPVDENMLTITWDRINILMDMKKDLSDNIFLEYTKSPRSLFTHVDNIRYVYNQDNKMVPTWYRKKYGHKFN